MSCWNEEWADEGDILQMEVEDLRDAVLLNGEQASGEVRDVFHSGAVNAGNEIEGGHGVMGGVDAVSDMGGAATDTP